MVDCYDISDWSPHPWLNTGGTRDKKFVLSPDNEYYYFKTSLRKRGKDYKHEFWNEIIAYHVGTKLGFKILRYDLAIDGNSVGCLSKTMINNDLQDLNEGGKYLKAYDDSFAPEDRKSRKAYTFKLIESTLIKFRLEGYLNNLLEILVFDSIIGNGDRHQENWAFIIELDGVRVFGLTWLERLIKYKYEGLPSWMKWILKPYKDKKDLKLDQRFESMRLDLSVPKEFAPIYDNGSSLGRELLDEKVDLYLTDNSELKKYINKGKSEVHWEQKKVSHFELLRKLMDYKFRKEIKTIIERVSDKFDNAEIEHILENIDSSLSNEFEEHRLPQNRKQLISRMINERVSKLNELVN